MAHEVPVSVLTALAIGLSLAQAEAKSPNYCDDKWEPGESIDGKAMMSMGMIGAHLLVEQYCGAPRIPLATTLVVIELAHGCGPRDRLEADAKRRSDEIGDIKAGDFLNVEDAATSAPEKDAATRRNIEAFGGCEELLKVRADVLKRYGN